MPESIRFVDYLVAAVERLRVAVGAVTSFHVNYGVLLTIVERFRVVLFAVAFKTALASSNFSIRGRELHLSKRCIQWNQTKTVVRSKKKKPIGNNNSAKQNKKITIQQLRCIN